MTERITKWSTIERIITDEMLTEFETELRNNEKSELTILKYMRDIRYFNRFVAKMSLDKSIVLSYKASLENSYAISSANSMLASLNAFFRFKGWHDLCVKQFKVQRKTFCNEKNELTRAEYTRLVRTAERQKNERLCLLLQTICGTGIRVRELQKKLIKYCKNQGIRTGQVFITKTGKPMSRTNIWREMKNLCKDAKVNPDKVFPHNLRHFFAMVFYGIQKDIAKLVDILGHSSIDTTIIYIITTGTEHRKRMESMRLIM